MWVGKNKNPAMSEERIVQIITPAPKGRATSTTSSKISTTSVNHKAKPPVGTSKVDVGSIKEPTKEVSKTKQPTTSETKDASSFWGGWFGGNKTKEELPKTEPKMDPSKPNTKLESKSKTKPDTSKRLAADVPPPPITTNHSAPLTPQVVSQRVEQIQSQWVEIQTKLGEIISYMNAHQQTTSPTDWDILSFHVREKEQRLRALDTERNQLRESITQSWQRVTSLITLLETDPDAMTHVEHWRIQLQEWEHLLQRLMPSS